jgi:hypothetical protein
MVGETYGRLLVFAYAYIKHNRACWYTRCVCGGFRTVQRTHLIRGDTTTCGNCKKWVGDRPPGHPMNYTPTYKSWSSMKSRCSVKAGIQNYNNYYGRGITVCDKWQKFEGFYDDMGDRPEGMTLERKNNNKGYNKRNCKWATLQEQSNNTRYNVRITHNGKTLTATQWGRVYGLGAGLICNRYHKGWPIDKVFSAPHTYRLHRKSNRRIIN